ncbi:MAG: PrsW family intramembrane metalloprotease [Candidatus Pacebacteria bacterium]|nr:PrsW family intramembrane metalloprotease [Candidatus Paceibacterota bacterium]
MIWQSLFLSSLLSALPIVAWLIFFLWQDVKKPEPKRWIFLCFSLGALTTPIAYWLENRFIIWSGINLESELSIGVNILLYGVIALIEELLKFLVIRIALKENRYFDEAIDAMIYLIAAALGFGVIENILASLDYFIIPNYYLNGIGVLVLRFIGANLVHVLSSGLIGYFWALFLISKKKYYLYEGLFWGILLHWGFNLAIIFFGQAALLSITIFLFAVTICLLWIFDTLKHIEKRIEY